RTGPAGGRRAGRALNTLDLLVVTAAVGAGFGGYRMGLLAHVTSWIGLALGTLLGAMVVPEVLDLIEDASDLQLLAVTLGTLLGMAFIGQALGLWVGAHMRLALPRGSAQQVDRGAGAAAGVIGVLVTLWLLLPL